MKKNKKKRLERLTRRKDERKQHREENFVSGVISVTPAGFGFVKIAPREDDADARDGEVFIPPQFVRDALDGDEVKVKILPPRPEDFGDRGPAGKVVEVTRRARAQVVGELLAGNVVRPLNKRLPEEIMLSGSRCGAKRGDWVQLELSHCDNGEWRGSMRKVIGRAGEIAADLDAVMSEYSLLPPYSAKEDAAAAEISPRTITREDCTGSLVLTIDPFDAKDFDDALSIRDDGDTVEIGVHISDVAAYIAPQSEFDKAAAARAFTAYLPGRTLPMLPKSLTAMISLQAGQDSAAHTVFVTVEKASGRVVSHRRAHTLVRVDHRLNYEEVQGVIDGKKPPRDWSRELCEALKLLTGVTRKMREFRRKNEQFIDLALPEIRVLCDEKTNRLLGLVSKVQRESEQLVEECMLAANSAVGEELAQKSVPGIYRVHPAPDADKIAEFSEMLESVFGIVPGDLSERGNCNEFIAKLPDDEKRPVILGLFLRSLPRASYLESPALHFGLGKGRYVHFTSPIRRYPDLTVHQQLWNLDLKNRLRGQGHMQKVALDCSQKEENNDAAYFAANDRLKLRYLSEVFEADSAKIYEGIVVKSFSGGMQVEIAELGLYGFIERDDLPGGFRRSGHGFVRERGTGGYRPGDFVYLRLERIDFARGRALFAPAGNR